MEYGMAAEPSALGSKIKFWQDNTPGEDHTLFHLEDIDRISDYQVERDGFMALTLHRIACSGSGFWTPARSCLRHFARPVVHGGIRTRHNRLDDGSPRESGVGP